MALQPAAWIALQAAALKMAYSEYSYLSTEERLAVLKGLTHLALSSEAIRDHFAAVAEAAVPAVPRTTAKKTVRPVVSQPCQSQCQF